jgi:outer membrane usher protein
LANGSLNYQGNRGVVGITQLSGLSMGRARDAKPYDPGHRTLLRAGTSIAFADGHVAVGQPIRNGAFAIVYPHESLAGNELTVGNDGNAVASSGVLGPALVSNIPGYIPSTIPISVSDLPVGYSLGASTIDTVAPYKAGYAVEVGSARSVSAFGTLTTASGEPAALRAGTAQPEGQPTPAIAIFTNAAGRFGAEGLGPGRWTIALEHDDDDKVQYTFVVPEKTTGLFKAGTLAPTVPR